MLADRYRLIDLLTESAGGRFWRAHDRVLERHVAVHVIAGDDERAALLREAARTSATVLDRRLLRVLDVDEAADLCFVVNEWGSGTSLDILLADGEPLSPTVAAWIVSEVADTVAVAHEVGVSHGRLVPENVLVDHDGGVRLIGFAVDAALHGLPPGRISTDVVDLVGLLYAALTGKWPGISRSVVTAAPSEHGQVLRPRQVRAGIPRTLDALCDEVPQPRRRRRRDRREVSDSLRDFLGPSASAAETWLARLDHPDRPQTVVLARCPTRPAREPDQPDVPDEPATSRSRHRGPRPRTTPTTARPIDERTPRRPDGRTPGRGACRPRRGCRSSTTRPTTCPGSRQLRAGATAAAVRGATRATALRARPDRRPARPTPPRGPGGGPPVRQRLLALGEHRDRGPAPAAASSRRSWTTRRRTTATRRARAGCGWPLIVAVCLLVLIGCVIAYNLGRGRTPLGAVPEDPSTPARRPARAARRRARRPRSPA